METAQILKQLHLLVVDDCHRTNAELYALFTGMFGQVSIATDAFMAAETFQNDDIDLIISDICMPGRDGLSFVESVRDRHPLIPIVILSAHSQKEYLLKAANLRVDGYLLKPLSFPKLNRALARVVRYLEFRLKPVPISTHVHYNPLLKCLEVDALQVKLGNKERRLLELLMLKHRVVGKQEIYDQVWPDGDHSEPALKNLLSELRRKLKYDLIKNRHGIGWVLDRRDEASHPA